MQLMRMEMRAWSITIGDFVCQITREEVAGEPQAGTQRGQCGPRGLTSTLLRGMAHRTRRAQSMHGSPAPLRDVALPPGDDRSLTPPVPSARSHPLPPPYPSTSNTSLSPPTPTLPPSLPP